MLCLCIVYLCEYIILYLFICRVFIYLSYIYMVIIMATSAITRRRSVVVIMYGRH